MMMNLHQYAKEAMMTPRAKAKRKKWAVDEARRRAALTPKERAAEDRATRKMQAFVNDLFSETP